MNRINLDLIAYKKELRLKKENGKSFIFCQIRKKWLVMQPEEIVRQLLILYLQSACNIKKARIAVEKGFLINNNLKRFDLLVLDKFGNPQLLMELKSAKEKIIQSTLDQVSVYNRYIKAPFLAICNGLELVVLEVDLSKNKYQFMDYLPSQTEMDSK